MTFSGRAAVALGGSIIDLGEPARRAQRSAHGPRSVPLRAISRQRIDYLAIMRA
jgi:hypothetical protein